ncbi:MAG: PD40 domain-containing protein [Acidobacteria bacterium]|nr:PD40 domain-containing protein [Acidobacteriota bacterium]
MQLTKDAAVDWNPVWSPDGRYIYFSSDRGGSTNLWRIAIDEKTGNAAGAPEPVTSGASADAAHAAFSKDGKRIVYASVALTLNIMRAPFDRAKGTAGKPEFVTEGSVGTITPNVSPDGSKLAVSSLLDGRLHYRCCGRPVAGRSAAAARAARQKDLRRVFLVSRRQAAGRRSTRYDGANRSCPRGLFFRYSTIRPRRSRHPTRLDRFSDAASHQHRRIADIPDHSR